MVPNDRRVENDARIRWADIYEHIVPHERFRDDDLLMGGSATPEEFDQIVQRYGLDIIVVPLESAGSETFDGLPSRPVQLEGEEYVTFGVNPC